MIQTRANDILPRYYDIGMWKSKITRKKGKASRTSSGVARMYIAVPPADGWPGGDPIRNGYRAGGRR